MRVSEKIIYLQLVFELVPIGRAYADIDCYDSRNDIANNSQSPVNYADSIAHTDPVRLFFLFKFIYKCSDGDIYFSSVCVCFYFCMFGKRLC